MIESKQSIHEILAKRLADLISETGEEITAEDIQRAYIAGFKDGWVEGAFGGSRAGNLFKDHDA